MTAGHPQVPPLLRDARVARLATADAAGQPHVVPVCFAFDGRAIYMVIDEKPKRTAPRRLRRIRNILANPRAALIVDHYEEDWRRLRYTLVTGIAHMIDSGPEAARGLALLREKYPQYRAMRLENRPVVKLSPAHYVHWAAAEGEHRGPRRGHGAGRRPSLTCGPRPRAGASLPATPRRRPPSRRDDPPPAR